MVERPAVKSTLLNDRDGERTWAVVCETGDEAMAVLASFAEEQKLAGSHFVAIGAFSRATVAYFDWATKKYRHLPIGEQVEVLSLAGDVTIEDGKPKVHAHVVVGKADATAHGGHLIEGHVRPTLEAAARECPGHLGPRSHRAAG